MAAGRAFHGALILALLAGGCGEPEAPSAEDTGFRVAAVVPVDGDEDVVESVAPELRLNAFADPVSCNADTVRLDRVGPGDVVVQEIAGALTFPDNGQKIQIKPEGGLPVGSWYMVSVRSGSEGCASSEGRVIRPFSSRFFVP